MSVWIDLLGYAASFIILVSLTMKSIVKLRWINAAGSLLFVVFAVLTRSAPTVVMNIGIIAIDLWYVSSLARKKGDYRLVRAERGSALLSFFYESNRAEIDALFGADAFEGATHFSYFMCNGEIAGLFGWKDLSATECRIMIDFVTPRFRDTKIGKHFFADHLSAFREKGYGLLVCENVAAGHRKYLGAIGFADEGAGRWTKVIDGEARQ
jgi:hypothetical protein